MNFKVGIVSSKQDIAGMNIRSKIMNLTDWEETLEKIDGNPVYYNRKFNLYLITIEKDIIYSDYLINYNLDVDVLIFISRHYSESGKPSLHVHFTGNWGDQNPYGGEPRSLSIAETIYARSIFLELYHRSSELSTQNFDVSLEVTHHGPSELNKPLVFVELGSRKEQWVLDEPAKLIAEIILDVIRGGRVEKFETAIGIGGPHYAPSFTRYLIENEIYISHIAPKYHFDSLDEYMFKLMIKRSATVPKLALIDWKGLRGPQRKIAVELAEKEELEVVRI